MTPNRHEAAPALGMSRAGDNSPGKAFLPATMAARTIVATGERGGEHTLHARRKGEAREDACPERHRQDEEFEVRLGKSTSALAWARRSRVLTSAFKGAPRAVAENTTTAQARPLRRAVMRQFVRRKTEAHQHAERHAQL